MQTRSSRGPSYIDAYEAQYDTSNEFGDKENINDLGRYISYVKNIVFVFNFIFLLIGLGLIVISFLRKPELNIFGYDPIYDNYMVYCYISIGVLIIITSFLGCSGATTQTKCIIILYILLLIITIILQILISIYIFTFDDENSKSNKFNHYITKYQWNNLTTNQQIQFENENNCIGYDNSCQIIIENNLKDNLQILNIISIIIAASQFIMCIISSVLCTKL